MIEPEVQPSELPTQSVGEAVGGRRTLVASRREQGLGVAIVTPDFEAPRPVPSTTAQLRFAARSVRALFVNWGRMMDPRELEGPKRALVIISLLAFNAGLDVAALGNLLPNIQATFGLDLTFLITLGTILTIVSQLFAPPLGWVADRVQRIWMVRIGGIFSAASTIAQGVAPSASGLALSRTLGGVGGSISGPASYPLMADWFPARTRTRAFAFYSIFAALGGIVGPTASGVLADRLGWQSTFVVLGTVALALSLLTFALKEPPRGYQDRREMSGSDQSVRVAAAPTFAESFRAAGSIVTVRRLWYAAPFLTVAALAGNYLIGLYYAQEFGLSAGQRGFLLTATNVLGLVALLAAGPLGDRLLAGNPGRVLTWLGAGMVFGAFVWVGLALSHSLALSFVLQLPGALFGPVITLALLTMLSLVVPARIRGFTIQSQAWFALPGQALILLLAPTLNAAGLRLSFVILIPFALIGAAIVGTAAPGVARDIRAAKAAALADEVAEQARLAGQAKMVVCRDLDVSYDGVQVLFNVDFDVSEGEIIALLGTNGAGKSTLLRAIAGVQSASNGAIFVDGREVTHAPPHENAARGIVMMPGGNAIFPTLTVAENLSTAAWMYRADPAYVAERSQEVYQLFPVLAERRDQPAGNLSGGEQQMVGLAQALLMRPRLLMIDELSLGLAPKVVEELLDVLRTIHGQGTTVIIVEQSLNVALTIAQRAVFMEKGTIRFSGPTAELLGRPDLIRAVFMGGRATRSRAPSVRAAGSPQPVLEISGVRVAFGGVQALAGVDLSVGDGEIVGLIGPNGAGKTTLFDVISGFVHPDAGTMNLAGVNVTDLAPDLRAKLGLARSFQNARLFPALTVRENLAVALERKAVRSAALGAVWAPQVRRAEQRIARRVDDLIEVLGLDAAADKFVAELSTGTRRAVDMAVVMAADPKVLLLDEPSSGLAQAEIEALGPVLLQLAKDTGCAMVVIEHDLPLITSVAHRLVVMQLGAVLRSGPPAEVVADPQVLASYLAASEGVVQRSGGPMASIAAAMARDSP